MSRATSKSGFTLLEIVLSITLLALMAIMILQVFSAGTKAVEMGKDQTLIDESARNLLDMIERDIHQALVRTNVPFRVETIETDPFNSLYFISTGVRRNLETIPRDMAPMKIYIEKMEEWNQALKIETADESAGSTASNRRKLSDQSDYYFSASDTAPDFVSVNSGRNMSTSRRTYTPALDTTDKQYAMLTTLRIIVNGDEAWDGNAAAEGTPDPDDLPRFVDIQIGLTPSSNIRQARRLSDAGNTARGNDLMAQHQQIYTRRVFMPNTGTSGLDFQ